MFHISRSGTFCPLNARWALIITVAVVRTHGIHRFSADTCVFFKAFVPSSGLLVIFYCGVKDPTSDIYLLRIVWFVPTQGHHPDQSYMVRPCLKKERKKKKRCRSFLVPDANSKTYSLWYVFRGLPHAKWCRQNIKTESHTIPCFCEEHEGLTSTYTVSVTLFL